MTYRSGLLILTAAATMASFNGLIVRSMEAADAYQVVVVRHLFMAAGLFLAAILRSRSGGYRFTLSLGMPGLVACVSYGIGSITFILALANTTVAQTLLIITALPVTTAIMARIFLKESVRPVAWLAMAGTIIGIVIMAGSIGEGGSIYGFIMAVMTVATMTYFAVGLRWGRETDMIPPIALGSLVAAFGAALISPSAPFDISLHDFMVLMIWGSVWSTVMILFFILASRSVPGGEMMLFIALEASLGPIWVWLAYDEVPTVATLVGGALILASVIGFAVSGMRQTKTEQT
jgi:drug/metabolite transporter (DMT)-like permease